MRQNPCRYCALAFVYKGKHIRSNTEECLKCENIKKHNEYLQSKRKFEEGDPITSIQELLEQEWVMWFHSTKHIEMFKSMTLRAVLNFINMGAIRKAVRKEKED